MKTEETEEDGSCAKHARRIEGRSGDRSWRRRAFADQWPQSSTRIQRCASAICYFLSSSSSPTSSATTPARESLPRNRFARFRLDAKTITGNGNTLYRRGGGFPSSVEGISWAQNGNRPGSSVTRSSSASRSTVGPAATAIAYRSRRARSRGSAFEIRVCARFRI